METTVEQFVEEQSIGCERGHSVDRVTECSARMVDGGIERISTEEKRNDETKICFSPLFTQE